MQQGQVKGMKRIGIAVYPDFMDADRQRGYLMLAKDLGFTKVFCSLLLGQMGFEGCKSDLRASVHALSELCSELGLQLCADANGAVFEMLSASPDDLSPFHTLGLASLRVDGGFSAAELARMSKNPLGIKIEVNASGVYLSGSRDSRARVEQILDELVFNGNQEMLCACHNFYPLPETGLEIRRTAEITDLIRAKGIKVGAFVASQSAPPCLYGAGHGLPTMEAHRYLPPHIAACELFALGFDEVIIGDAPASEEELRRVAQAASGAIDIPIVPSPGADKGVLESLYRLVFLSRTDQPELIIRSEISRGILVPPGNAEPRPTYTVCILNSGAGRYMGELQISTSDLPPSGTHNVIGCVHPDARRLIEYLKGGEREFTISQHIGGADE